MTTSINDFIYDINQMVDDKVNSDMTEVSASDLGLDNRAGYRLYVSEDAIAVQKERDGSLQYYGGFEYVDKEFRREMGDWVFYMKDEYEISCRVSECLERYFDEKSDSDED